MAGEMQHLYLTCHGVYPSGPWEGEAAQIGFRFAFAGVGASPAQGETFTMQLNGQAVPEFGTATGTNGTLTKTWTARVGTTGSLENWGESEQIGAAEAARTLLNVLKSSQSNEFRWTSVKQAAVDDLGHTIGTASTYTFTTPIVGSATSGLPAQCAIAVSARANIVGRSGRGRFYVPALGTNVLTSEGQTGSSVLTAWNTAFKAYIDEMQGVLGGLDLWRAVYCITSAGKATAVRPAEVRTGNIIDTIRTRRAQVDETYYSLAL